MEAMAIGEIGLRAAVPTSEQSWPQDTVTRRIPREDPQRAFRLRRRTVGRVMTWVSGLILDECCSARVSPRRRLGYGPVNGCMLQTSSESRQFSSAGGGNDVHSRGPPRRKQTRSIHRPMHARWRFPHAAANGSMHAPEPRTPLGFL